MQAPVMRVRCALPAFKQAAVVEPSGSGNDWCLHECRHVLLLGGVAQPEFQL
jgi:hypothetical protein